MEKSNRIDQYALTYDMRKQMIEELEQCKNNPELCGVDAKTIRMDKVIDIVIEILARQASTGYCGTSTDRHGGV